MPAVRVRFLAPGLFCVLRRPTKNIHEVPMSKSVLLSRSARFCAGRVPLPPLLTSAPILGNLSFPKSNKACRSLRQRPTLEKRAAFSVSATERKRAVPPAGCGYILAEQRPDVRETQAALFEPGSVVPPFLFPILKSNRWLMSHSISLSRSAALCGGFLPLELLARKLDRFGEAEALQALLRLPLSLSSRVRWTMRGTTLSVEVAA